jgi:ABC-type cobalt transport system substrate-binding protein
MIILFIVALVLLLVFMIFYFKGGINLFGSIKEVNGTNVVNNIKNNYYP